MTVTTDTHRKLGVGERLEWGDVMMVGGESRPIHEHWVTQGLVVHEDDQMGFYRPIHGTVEFVQSEENPRVWVHVAPAEESRGQQKGFIRLERALTEPKALTHDDGKPPLAYLPTAAIREEAKVQAYGHKKYGDFWNYRKGMEIGRNLSCALRHIYAFMDGEDQDPESGCSHLAHARCRLGFVLQNLHDGTAIDDRFKK